MGPMDKEGKTIWVLCSAARAVENEIARASKQPSPGHTVLGSVREFSNLLGGFGEMRRPACERVRPSRGFVVADRPGQFLR